MSLHLGLDVGTQGTKGLVLDADAGVIVARASAAYGLIEGLEPGAAEQHPDTWTDAIRAVAAELMAADGVDPAAFASVGVSGQQHGLVVLDGTFKSHALDEAYDLEAGRARLFGSAEDCRLDAAPLILIKWCYSY